MVARNSLPDVSRRTAVLVGILLAVVVTLFAATRVSAQAPANGSPPPYTITLADLLRIDVYQEDDLRTLSRVDTKGTVNLPLVGEVKVVGLTVSDAQKAIETAYREGRYIRQPQVTINIEAYAAREVSINGQVKTPGRYTLPIETSMTLIDLVTRAGGFTDNAAGTKVAITRLGRDGQKQTFTVDVDSVLKGRGRTNANDATFFLQPGDIVYVPERII